MSTTSITDTTQALLFLALHGPEHAQKLLGTKLRIVDPHRYKRAPAGEGVFEVIGDLKAKVTVTDDLKLIFELPTIHRTFTSDKAITPSPKGLTPTGGPVDGIFFARGNDITDFQPNKRDTLWVQQFPSYEQGTGKPGRLVVDFYNDQKIVGVFATYTDNYGGESSGLWKET